MDKKIIVFDFDKTLTYRDTLFGFYISISEKGFKFLVKICSYFFLMVLFKIRIISNDYLKKQGFKIFIKNKELISLEKKAKLYANSIKFNNLFNSFDFKRIDYKIIVISASYQIYLKYIFNENIEVFGSEFKIENGLASEFDYNCYSNFKSKILKHYGYEKIDVLYTDSFSDFSLAKLSQSINIVKNDNIYECSNINQFKEFFK